MSQKKQPPYDLSMASEGQALLHPGRYAESLAARHLTEKGYIIVEQNKRIGPAEIDIIARKDDLLCFVEVKGRITPQFGSPQEYVDSRKQRRIALGASIFHDTQTYHQYRVRFDVISIDFQSGVAVIEHLENAFEVDP